MKRRAVMVVGCCMIIFCIMACGIPNSSLTSQPTDEEILAQVKEKIKNGTPVDTKDVRGQTSLMWAAQKNSVPIAKLLIENGADVNATDNNGQTPLIYAAMNDSLDVAEMLIASGANINVRDKFTLTAFLWAEVKRFDDMITLLGNHGGR